MLKKLKSLFITEDEQTGSKSQSKAKPKAQESPNPVENAKTEEYVAPASTAQISEGKVTSKFSNILLGAMDKNNLEGFDYLEYKQALQNLSKMVMDEPTRYKSAFAAAQTMGATPQKLISTAGHYLKVLSQEEQKFNQALANQKQKQIAGQEDNYKKLDQSIKDKKTRIQQLQKEIEAHEAKMATIKKSVNDASIKVKSTHNDFVATYQTIVAKIQTDIEKMKQYLA